ncbi:MAG: LiaI-LiaF-like domain-containing protein [Bryobacteraceae bacterium]
MNATSLELIQAIRGPIMLITLGALVALDYFQGISFSRRTWPVLLIVFGLMKLLERAGRPPVYPPPVPYAGTTAVPPGGSTL